MLYRVIKMSERKFVVARDGFNSTMISIAECKTEHSAHDVAKALNLHPQPEAVTAEAVAQREIDRAFTKSKN